MSRTRIQHFLLIYDREQGRLVQTQDFGEDQDTALAACAHAEAEHWGDHTIEIVLVGSDSLETVRITHANHFEETITSPYLIRI